MDAIASFEKYVSPLTSTGQHSLLIRGTVFFVLGGEGFAHQRRLLETWVGLQAICLIFFTKMEERGLSRFY